MNLKKNIDKRKEKVEKKRKKLPGIQA